MIVNISLNKILKFSLNLFQLKTLTHF